MRFWLYLLTFNLTFSYTITSDVLTNFTVIIKTPGNELPPTQIPYKSIHVKYTLPRSDDQWNIVAIEPFIQISNETIQQLTVHLCQTTFDTYQQNAIRYDDRKECNDARSMLIYQWTSGSPISTFQISDDLGFQLDKTKFLVLTVTYSQKQQIHYDQSGVILSIITQIPRFYIGTLFVGNKQRGILEKGFSCRSLNQPRLLYAVKPLFSSTNNSWWGIYVIRNRNFGRKLVQSVINSTIFSKQNQTDMEIISSDIFLIPGDYIIIECTQICQFLIFYTYKNLPYQDLDENEHICQDDNYPDLFKLIPSTITKTNETPQSMDGTTIFLLICMLLLVIWISIIIGCVIMRRIRGLVNFRSEPSSPYSNQTTKSFFTAKSGTQDQNQQRIAAEGDRTAQLDIEHMGLMS